MISPDWDPPFGNVRLQCLTWNCSLRMVRLETFACELCLGVSLGVCPFVGESLRRGAIWDYSSLETLARDHFLAKFA